jgi:hypothetical protein
VEAVEQVEAVESRWSIQGKLYLARRLRYGSFRQQVD